MQESFSVPLRYSCFPPVFFSEAERIITSKKREAKKSETKK